MNKVISPIIIILIIIAGIIGYFVLKPDTKINCGDGVCDVGESCETCPKDCGTCQEPPPDYEESPFGIMAAFDMSTLTYIDTQDKIAWAGNHFRNLGAKWSRGAGEFITWSKIEPVLGGGYDWSNSDEVLKRVYENGGDNFNMVVIVSPTRETKGSKRGSIDIKPSEEEDFKKFVKAAVERYDGDGIDDFDSDIKVKYWQAANEPFPRGWEDSGGTVDGYARFVELLSQSAKEADPDAKIILGAAAMERPEHVAKYNEVILEMKNKNLFDYSDTHYWSNKNNYKIPITDMRTILDASGYDYVKIVSLEHGTWMGHPSPTEKEQAGYLIKSYAYNIAQGVSVINWNNLVEWSNYGGNPRSIYNFMGLIADGQNGDVLGAGVPRLAYYTYKLMVDKLEGSDWGNIETVQESDNVYIYKFTKQGKPIWVAWNDNLESKTISISGITSNQVKITEAVPKYESGKEVTDYNSAFSIETKTLQNNKISITLGDVPVFVEEK